MRPPRVTISSVRRSSALQSDAVLSGTRRFAGCGSGGFPPGLCCISSIRMERSTPGKLRTSNHSGVVPYLLRFALLVGAVVDGVAEHHFDRRYRKVPEPLGFEFRRGRSCRLTRQAGAVIRRPLRQTTAACSRNAPGAAARRRTARRSGVRRLRTVWDDARSWRASRGSGGARTFPSTRRHGALAPWPGFVGGIDVPDGETCAHRVASCRGSSRSAEPARLQNYDIRRPGVKARWASVRQVYT